MTLPRVPSFSMRPGFPSGLQVLLVDSNDSAREKAAKQLEDLKYNVTSCSTCAEAVEAIKKVETSLDIALVEADVFSEESDTIKNFLDLIQPLPLVLMSENGHANEVMKGIKLGAVDFLEKPLSSLKLRNVWQHVVRKMMSDVKSKPSSKVSPVEGTEKEATPLSPKTPSPSASGAEAASITSNASKMCEGESSSNSDGSKENKQDGADSKTASALSRPDDSKAKPKPITVLPTHRPPLAIKPNSYCMMPPMQGFLPPGGWRAPANGCVWGTPVVGPQAGMVPPPMAAPLPGMHTFQPPMVPPMLGGMPASMIPTPPPMVPILPQEQLPQTSHTATTVAPVFEMELDANCWGEDMAPIGLALKKSPSLVDLINKTLTSSVAY